MKNFWNSIPFMGLALGLSVSFLLTWLMGENPFQVASILLKSALGSPQDLGLTLFYSTAFIFTGLSFSIAVHAGLFNIGAEGQLTLAAMGAAFVGVIYPALSFPLSVFLALAVALCLSACWGMISSWLHLRYQIHEVITSIMLNFIAIAITSWMALQIIPNPDSQNPETAKIGSTYLMRTWDPFVAWFDDSPANLSFVVAVFLSLILWIFLWKTAAGFELRAVGENSEAADRAGISVGKIKLLAMGLAGMCAGFVALNEVLGYSGQFKIGFSPDYGFIGIAVSLLARNHPIGIIFSGLLFGFMHKGAMDMDLETENITRDFSKVLQSTIILAVCLKLVWSPRLKNLFSSKFKSIRKQGDQT